ncbi:MAG: hypothetical protein ACTSVO_02780, partial [Candidatus Heimdallarchaeaceae archaeon]
MMPAKKTTQPKEKRTRSHGNKSVENMHIVVVIDSDTDTSDLVKICHRLFTHNPSVFYHIIISGTRAGEFQNLLTRPSFLKTVSVVSEPFSFSSAILYGKRFLKEFIKPYEFIMVTKPNYYISWNETKKRFAEVEYTTTTTSSGTRASVKTKTKDLSKIYVKYRIIADTLFPKLRIKDYDEDTIKSRVGTRIRSINRKSKEGKAEIKVSDYICGTKMKNFLNMLSHLEEQDHDFQLSDFPKALDKLGLEEIDSGTDGLDVGKDPVSKYDMDNIKLEITPDYIVRRMIKQGYKVKLRIHAQSALLDDERKKVVLAFPDNPPKDLERTLGKRREWENLIKLLNKTKSIYTFIAGEYPWGESDFEKKMNNIYIIKNQWFPPLWYKKALKIETKEDIVFNKADVLFGILTENNRYIELANTKGLPNIFIGWYGVEELENNPQKTLSIGIKQVGVNFESVEVYN